MAQQSRSQRVHSTGKTKAKQVDLKSVTVEQEMQLLGFDTEAASDTIGSNNVWIINRLIDDV